MKKILSGVVALLLILGTTTQSFAQVPKANLQLIRYKTECRGNSLYPDRYECESYWEDDTPMDMSNCSPGGMAFLFGLYGAILFGLGADLAGSNQVGLSAMGGGILMAGMGLMMCELSRTD